MITKNELQEFSVLLPLLAKGSRKQKNRPSASKNYFHRIHSTTKYFRYSKCLVDKLTRGIRNEEESSVGDCCNVGC